MSSADTAARAIEAVTPALLSLLALELGDRLRRLEREALIRQSAGEQQ
jgi:hypothetical protein